MYKLETQNPIINERAHIYSANPGNQSKSRQGSSKRKMTPENWNI